jgi:NADPH:quinone reductase-like Zn-dependent oxidoreductase
MCLCWRARLSPGERVLVLGAVGQAALGAARVLGAGRVVAVCRSAGAEQRARRVGADDVVLLAGTSSSPLRQALAGPASALRVSST